MKKIINYYYDFDCIDILENKNYYSFFFNGDNYFFVFFNRSIDELKDLIYLCYELKLKGIKVHDIILNKFNSYLTKVGDIDYILLKLNSNSKDIVDFFELCNNLNNFKLNKVNSKLYRNNWGELWSKKVDYLEYQISEIGRDKKVILDSFSYYIGLCENAISYVNKINKVLQMSENDNITLSHRRIFYPNINLNYLNPLSFIFDLEVRDVAESLKVNFFNEEDALLDLKTFLKTKKLTNYGYHMLYARLLYPSYYFDLYEDIMNNNADENKLIDIIKKVDDYEYFLKSSYDEINKYTSLEKVDWILKKEL